MKVVGGAKTAEFMSGFFRWRGYGQSPKKIQQAMTETTFGLFFFNIT
jgi:hypothetical protein